MRVHVEITGLVQGVGFRWFVRQHARALGLAGWVKNEASRAVRVVAEGGDEDVARFLDAIRRGPPGSRVDDVRSLPTEELGDLPNDFAVMR